jgi:hypothetical protein
LDNALEDARIFCASARFVRVVGFVTRRAKDVEYDFVGARETKTGVLFETLCMTCCEVGLLARLVEKASLSSSLLLYIKSQTQTQTAR